MPSPPPGVIDVPSVLARFQHSDDLVRDLVGIFIENGWKLLDEAHQAVARADHDQTAASAHALKGALATLSATAATEAAARLESAARNGNANVQLALRQLDTEMARLRPALDSLVDGMRS